MRKIDINLARKRRPAALIQWMLAAGFVLIALAYSASSAYVYFTNKAKLGGYEERLGKLEMPSGFAKGGSVQAEGDESRKRLKNEVEFINGVIIMDSFSWTGLLSVLEECVPPNVSIVQISPDFREGKIRVTGIAAAMSDIISFVDRMNGSKGFKDAFLLKHSEDKAAAAARTSSEGPRPVLFNISAVYAADTRL